MNLSGGLITLNDSESLRRFVSDDERVNALKSPEHRKEEREKIEKQVEEFLSRDCVKICPSKLIEH